MNDSTRAVVGLLVVGAASLGFFVTTDSETRAGAHSAEEFDLRGLTPGEQRTVLLGASELTISVPGGEGASVGSYRLRVSPCGFDSSDLERDGSLESVLVADVNHDEIPDAVLVTRSAGSGSFGRATLVESSGDRFVVSELPGIPTGFGYRGHDRIFVRDGSVLRTYPTYAPSDPNAAPSGASIELVFDRTAQRWGQEQ